MVSSESTGHKFESQKERLGPKKKMFLLERNLRQNNTTVEVHGQSTIVGTWSNDVEHP